MLTHNQRKINSVKGMKDSAHAKAVQTKLSSAAGEDKLEGLCCKVEQGADHTKFG